MTARDDLWRTARNSVVNTLVAAATALSLATVATVATGSAARLQALWQLPEAVEENRRAIEALRVPRFIFEIGERSGPVRGYCVEGEACQINIQVRRLRDALGCQLVPETVQYYYRNPRTNEITSVEILAGRPRDVGVRWIILPFTFTTPFGLVPEAELCVEPGYIGCPGQAPDGPLATQAPECFDVPIQDSDTPPRFQ